MMPQYLKPKVLNLTLTNRHLTNHCLQLHIVFVELLVWVSANLFVELQSQKELSNFLLTDYNFIYFSGHGYTSHDYKRMLALRDNNIEDLFFINDSPRQLIVVDSCRNYVSPGISGIPDLGGGKMVSMWSLPSIISSTSFLLSFISVP